MNPQPLGLQPHILATPLPTFPQNIFMAGDSSSLYQKSRHAVYKQVLLFRLTHVQRCVGHAYRIFGNPQLTLNSRNILPKPALPLRVNMQETPGISNSSVNASFPDTTPYKKGGVLILEQAGMCVQTERSGRVS